MRLRRYGVVASVHLGDREALGRRAAHLVRVRARVRVRVRVRERVRVRPARCPPPRRGAWCSA